MKNLHQFKLAIFLAQKLPFFTARWAATSCPTASRNYVAIITSPCSTHMLTPQHTIIMQNGQPTQRCGGGGPSGVRRVGPFEIYTAFLWVKARRLGRKITKVEKYRELFRICVGGWSASFGAVLVSVVFSTKNYPPWSPTLGTKEFLRGELGEKKKTNASGEGKSSGKWARGYLSFAGNIYSWMFW